MSKILYVPSHQRRQKGVASKHSGASQHIVGEKRFKDDIKFKQRASRPIRVKTANGIVELTEVVLTQIGSQGSQRTHVFDECFALLSLGEVCAKHGHTFVWSAHEKVPIFLDQAGKPIPLRIVNNVPCFDEDDIVSE